MKRCRFCGQDLEEAARFCIRCGKPVAASLLSPETGPETEEMSMPALYVMVAGLVLALLFPPWETPPGQPPEFLGFHFFLSPPDSGTTGSTGSGVVSRLLLTIELVTIAVAGLYVSWLFRKRR
jgi:hypothetical protein